MSAAIRDEHFRYTGYAGQIDNSITKVIEPIFERCMRDGMSHADFMYVAFSAINEMILIDLIQRQS